MTRRFTDSEHEWGRNFNVILEAEENGLCFGDLDDEEQASIIRLMRLGLTPQEVYNSEFGEDSNG